MGDRGGLIDTAVKTSETGYIQRKLIKVWKILKFHMTFQRNADGNIIEFCMEKTGDYKIESQPFPENGLSDMEQRPDLQTRKLVNVPTQLLKK